MKNIKKFMSALSLVVMAFVCAFAFAGCGASADEFAKAESATAEEITEYLGDEPEFEVGNGFEMTLKMVMSIQGLKFVVSVRAKILFEDNNVSKAVCVLSASEGGQSGKIYAYVKNSKLYTRTKAQGIDQKYVNDFDGDFGLGGQYDLEGLQAQIQDAINQVSAVFTDASEEDLAKLGLKKIVDEENGTARFQIKATISGMNLGDLFAMATEENSVSATFVIGFEDNKLVEVSTSLKTKGMSMSTTVKGITEISDGEYPSETELAKYVPGNFDFE